MISDSLRKWQFAQVLASITALTILFALFMNLFVLGEGEIYRVHPVIGLPLTIAIFWFWGWMAIDVLGGGAPTNTVFWFIVVALIPVFGALYYYSFVWRPMNRKWAA